MRNFANLIWHTEPKRDKQTSIKPQNEHTQKKMFSKDDSYSHICKQLKRANDLFGHRSNIKGHLIS